MLSLSIGTEWLGGVCDAISNTAIMIVTRCGYHDHECLS